MDVGIQVRQAELRRRRHLLEAGLEPAGAHFDQRVQAEHGAQLQHALQVARHHAALEGSIHFRFGLRQSLETVEHVHALGEAQIAHAQREEEAQAPAEAAELDAVARQMAHLEQPVEDRAHLRPHQQGMRRGERVVALENRVQVQLTGAAARSPRARRRMPVASSGG